MNPTELRQNAAKAASLLKALAHEERLTILCQLVGGELCVASLLAHSSLSQSALSQHLSVLRNKGLVTTRKQSQQVFYSLANQEAIAVLATLHQLYCAS